MEKSRIFFEDVTAEEATKLLKERADMTISFEDPEIKSNRFTTVFLKNESIEQVLKSICEFNEAFINIIKKSDNIY